MFTDGVNIVLLKLWSPHHQKEEMSDTARCLETAFYIITFYVLILGPRQLSRYSDSLRAGWSGDRIPVGGETSRTSPVQSWGRPSLLTMGTGSFMGVKRTGSGTDHPPTSSSEVKVRVELYICSPSGPSWHVIGRTLPLSLTFIF